MVEEEEKEKDRCDTPLLSFIYYYRNKRWHKVACMCMFKKYKTWQTGLRPPSSTEHLKNSHL
jgi:hypothetical protein